MHEYTHKSAYMHDLRYIHWTKLTVSAIIICIETQNPWQTHTHAHSAPYFWNVKSAISWTLSHTYFFIIFPHNLFHHHSHRICANSHIFIYSAKERIHIHTIHTIECIRVYEAMFVAFKLELFAMLFELL